MSGLQVAVAVASTVYVIAGGIIANLWLNDAGEDGGATESAPRAFLGATIIVLVWVPISLYVVIEAAVLSLLGKAE